MTSPRAPWPWWRCAMTGLGALGLALSSYLGWHYVAGGTVLGCDGGSPCDQVLGSRWSTVGGVLPVSGLAAGVYLAVLLLSFYLGPVTESSVRRLAWRLLLVLAAAAVGSAVWFTIVQKWLLGAFCPWCMATHTTGLLLGAMVFSQVWRELAAIPPNETPVQPASVSTSSLARKPPPPILGSALIGVALAGLMAVCQVVYAPKVVSQVGDSPVVASLPKPDPHAVPLIGSPDAAQVVMLFFDYNCPHCQQLHGLLEEVVQRYHGKLAFMLCPTPLNPRCNPYVPQEVAAFKDSCELARLALVVWVAKREAFAEFDRWMFTAEPTHLWRPRSLEAAQTKAAELVGAANLTAASTTPWIERHLQTSIQLYGLNGAAAVPKLVFGPHWVTPQPGNADDLIDILQSALNVPPP